MRWITALLTWFAADPQAIDTQQPRAAACVCAARASLMKESETDAKQNQDIAPTVVTDDSSGQATKARRQQPTDSSSAGLLLKSSQGLEAGCADGSCVAVPAVRSRVYRSRRGSR